MQFCLMRSRIREGPFPLHQFRQLNQLHQLQQLHKLQCPLSLSRSWRQRQDVGHSPQLPAPNTQSVRVKGFKTFKTNVFHTWQLYPRQSHTRSATLSLPWTVTLFSRLWTTWSVLQSATRTARTTWWTTPTWSWRSSARMWSMTSVWTWRSRSPSRCAKSWTPTGLR